MSASNGTTRGASLLPQHLADLKRSGLSDDTIKISRAYSEFDPAKVAGLLNWDNPAKSLGSCLVFPFFDIDGEPMHYCRIKPDSTPILNGKSAKYVSPSERPGRVYFPPQAREAVGGSSQLVIVEGEKKSLAADQHGYACIGLVGVWGWIKKREDDSAPRELNPDLDGINWEKRDVVIVFDSDVVSNGLSQSAEWEFSKLLTARGASVRVVRLPAKLGGPKVGLDDYLLANGKDAFDDLLRRAAPATMPTVGFSNTIRVAKPDDGKSEKEQKDKDKREETIDLPRSSDAIAIELVGVSGGWPRCVGGLLVAPDLAGGVRPLADAHQLFAYAGEVFGRSGISGVTWSKGNGCVTKQEFYEYLVANCERFTRAESLPHVPPIDGFLYLNPSPVPDDKFEALERFLSFFSPASDADAALLLACLLTPLWGGPPGKRPAFLFEADENDAASGRGVGKSTVAQKIAGVFGGAFNIDAGEPFTRTVSRLLTPSAACYRVLLMDNVKTFRLSSAELESLITSVDVNGHRLYHGQAAVPNYYTFFLTLNGPSLSRDVAQRVVPIRFTRAKYRNGWEAEVDAFLARNRDRLIADLIGVMQQAPAKLARVTRWGAWESEVLARVDSPDGCMKLIEDRTSAMDADRDDGERIRETWLGILSRALGHSNGHSCRFLLSSSAITSLVETALNRRFSAADASAQMKVLGVKGFRKSDRKGRRLWL